jgi:hypothetical protein
MSVKASHAKSVIFAPGPANRSPAWKPNHDPHQNVTIMPLTINDTTLTSDQNPHTARQAPGRPHQRKVSWLPGQILDRTTANTAMLLAAVTARGDLHQGHRLWPRIQCWAAELGLTGPEAIAQATEPPRYLDPRHERASGHPDKEAAD